MANETEYVVVGVGANRCGTTVPYTKISAMQKREKTSEKIVSTTLNSI